MTRRPTKRARRRPLNSALETAAATRDPLNAQRRLQLDEDAPSGTVEADDGTRPVATGVVLTVEHQRLLRAVALVRAHDRGGRPSVSEVIRTLIDDHADELRTEANRARDLLTF